MELNKYSGKVVCQGVQGFTLLLGLSGLSLCSGASYVLPLAKIQSVGRSQSTTKPEIPALF